ncbi:MAG: hypothetical protein IPJ74_05525 [Saprospiraceae bacterium]|nr:hypothetical protein [Saprospiraceae bacterium]
MKSLIKLAILLIIGILVYNYFFGSQEEKETSKKIFGEVRDLGKATWDLLRSEKQKFNDGKYDEAVDKVGGLLDKLRGHAETIENNKDLIARINELEQDRKALERDINTPPAYGVSEAQRKEELKRESDQLLREIEALMKEMEQR